MPKIIAVHSYRGGTGKSNLVANLATLLAAQRFRVAVIDTDLQSPGVHNIFDLAEDQVQYTLNDYLWKRCDIEATAYDVSQAAGVENRGQIWLVPASINPNEIARILSEGYSASHLNSGMNRLMRQFDLDYLLIDTHPGLSKETFFSIAIANLLLLLLRPDRQDFQGTAVTVDVARQLQVPNMRLVVNKVLQNVDTDDLTAQLEQTYDTPVAGILPACQEMMQLGSEGVFCQYYPAHPWTEALSALVQGII
ncbi:MAG: MinD/ParA family ATP-binding protein [Thainema sp.]